MSRAILHIGLPKTGTTAIQEMLSRNRSALAKAGLCYPSFMGSPNHLELAVYAADYKSRAGDLLSLEAESDHSTFREEFRGVFESATASGDWIFSSEHLASRLRSVGAVERVGHLLSHFDSVRIIVYVRPQDSMAAASYSTWVKDGFPDEFSVERHLDYVERYDFKRVVMRWDEVFGPTSVDVRLYPSEGLLKDFLEAIGLDSADWEFAAAAPNASLDSKELAFVREMNRRLPRWDNGPTARFLDLSNVVAGTGDGERLCLTPDDRRLILERFASSNEWVMSRASNAARYPGYFDPPADDSEPGSMADELTVDDALEMARALWAKASASEKQLKRALGEA